MSDPDPTARAAENQFLKEGVGLYLDALTALVEFRRKVYAKCKSVLEQRLEAYSEALGPEVRLDSQRIAIWTDEGDSFNGTGTNYGIRLVSGLSAGVWGDHRFGLGWEKQKDGTLWFGTTVALWVNLEIAYRQLLNKFTSLGPKEPFKLFDGRRWLWFYTTLAEADMAELETKLDETLVGWIDLWKQSRGANAIFAGLK